MNVSSTNNYILDVNEYGNVTAYSDNVEAIPNGWVKSNLTVTQLKKLEIPTYKACVGFDNNYSDYYTPIIVNIIPEDFVCREVQYRENLATKERLHKEKVISKMSVQKVAEALYSINKEAKKYRDKQNEHAYNAYNCYSHYLPKSSLHYLIHKNKDKKEFLYALKNQALSKLIKDVGAKPVGYHSFDNYNMDYYVIGGYSFHVNAQTSKNFLGTITELISSEKKRSMTAKDAVILLNAYLSV